MKAKIRNIICYYLLLIFACFAIFFIDKQYFYLACVAAVYSVIVFWSYYLINIWILNRYIGGRKFFYISKFLYILLAIFGGFISLYSILFLNDSLIAINGLTFLSICLHAYLTEE